MGQRRIAKLPTSPDTIEQATLWTRGGLGGVQVKLAVIEIDIPRELLIQLCAAEYRSLMVSEYEQMTDEEAWAEMTKGRTT